MAISTSALARSLQPSPDAPEASDGSASALRFPRLPQELRFAVALVLKEMADLEKRCKRKLQD